MLVAHFPDDPPVRWHNPVLALGNFDGLHRGHMFRRGVLVLGAGKNAIRLAPPLVFSRAQADTLLRVVDEALTEVRSSGR